MNTGLIQRLRADRDRNLKTGLSVSKKLRWEHGVQKQTVVQVIKDDRAQSVLLSLPTDHAIEIAIRILQAFDVEYGPEASRALTALSERVEELELTLKCSEDFIENLADDNITLRAQREAALRLCDEAEREAQEFFGFKGRPGVSIGTYEIRAALRKRAALGAGEEAK